MTQHLEHLQLARRHLAEAEARIARQAEIVRSLEAAGHPAGLARDLLVSFNAVLVQMRAHRDFLESETDVL